MSEAERLKTDRKLTLMIWLSSGILLGTIAGAYLTQATFNNQCKKYERTIPLPFYNNILFVCGAA